MMRRMDVRGLGALLLVATVALGAGCDGGKRGESVAPAAEPAAEPAPQALPELPPEPKRTAPHGALDMKEQQALLDAAGTAPALGTPPGVDAEAWAGLLPEDNQPTAQRVALGRKLYFDTRLSRDGTLSCATCHDVSRGLTDRRPVSEGIDGKVGRRNAPTTMNAALYQTQFLDGRAPSLEEQAKLPITNPIEMGQPDPAAALAAIAGDSAYEAEFEEAYAREINFDDIARAIAAFERTLVYLDAPFDHFIAGDANALSDDAKAGWVLYNGKARCAACHQLNGSSPLGTNNLFHNVGVSARHQNFEDLVQKGLEVLGEDDSVEAMDRLALETDLSELGRFVVTQNYSDIGAFKTQAVRNVGITAPYMHDGSLQTLWDVIDHYNKGGEANPFLDGGIEPLTLSENEIDQLVAFLFSLTDERFAAQNQREMRRQRAIANERRPFRDEALAMRRVLPFEKASGSK